MTTNKGGKMSTQNLTVYLEKDKRLFLEKVIEIGRSNQFLTRNDCERILSDLNKLFGFFHGLIGFNPASIDQSLKIGEMVKNLLSIVLEKKSLQQISVAIEILKTADTNQLIRELIEEIRQFGQRLHRTIKINVGETIYESKIELIFGPAQHDAYLNHEAHDWSDVNYEKMFWTMPTHFGNQAFVPQIPLGFTTWNELNNWQQAVIDLEQQFFLSQKYLPWQDLIETSQMKFRQSQGFLRDFVWSSETLLATLMAIMVTGTSLKFRGRSSDSRYNRVLAFETVYHHESLDSLIRFTENSEYYRDLALARLNDYIETAMEKTPKIKEHRQLLKMAEETLTIMLANPNRVSRKSLTYWTERIQMDVSCRQVGKSIMRAKRKQPKSSRTQNSTETKATPEQKLISLFEKSDQEPSTISVNYLLQTISWNKALNQGLMERLLVLLDSEMAEPTLPLMPNIVDRVCAWWQTEEGQRRWDTKIRVQFVSRIRQGASRLFWKQITEDTVNTLKSTLPEQAEAIDFFRNL